MLSQKDDIIELGNLYPGELVYSAFEITENSTVTIKGKAGNFGKNFSEKYVFYGWILDSETRKIVWDAREDFDFENQKGMYKFEDKEPLDKGFYEVYYTSSSGYGVEINSFSDLMSNIFSGFKGKKFKDKYRTELGLTVIGEKGKFKTVDKDKVFIERTKNAIVSISHVQNSQDAKKGFALKADTKMKIYSIGEGIDEGIYDLAWITDAKSNKIVWKPTLDDSDHAGGGKKNYFVENVIELPKGSYILNYSSDDSHSFEEWSVMPPNDPQFWGATIWATSNDDLQNIIPFNQDEILNPMIEIVKVGDDELRNQGFKLNQDSKLNILCLGEGYNEKDLADYGWIINAETKETLWSMNGNKKISHAGGAKKNLMVEETIELKKGNYIANYSSDDSHSYAEWNASNPFDRTRWGLTIWNETNNYELFDANNYRSKNILVELIRVTDNKDLKEKFTLKKNTKIRILAIGEGSKSGMDDYGWIEDENGDVIWEMTYSQTRHAGGSSKNRLYNKTFTLDKGEYTVFYTSDDSHSYNDWNSAAPNNQENYGITILLEK
jgi:hypothetical protein